MPEEPYKLSNSHVRQIRRMIIGSLALTRDDLDDLTSLIVLYCLEHRIDPTWTLVRHRCIDWIRRTNRERRTLEAYGREASPPDTDIESLLARGREELVGLLISEAELTEIEKQVLWSLFYGGLTIEQTALANSLTVGTVAEIKRTTLGKLYLASLRRKDRK